MKKFFVLLILILSVRQIVSDSVYPSLIYAEENTPTDLPTASAAAGFSNILVNQSVNAASDTVSESDSGNNFQSASGSSTIITGNADSIANSITIVNLSEVNSNLITTIQTIINPDNPDVNLYEDLLSAIADNPNFIPESTNITVNQTADVTTNTGATANTGNNSQNSDADTMTTGQANAVSNAITTVNLNLVGSNAVLAIINIYDSYGRDVILPDRSLLISSSDQNVADVNITSNQSSNVSSETTSGQAEGAANSTILTDIVQTGEGWEYLILNNYGNWTGSLINWQFPGSIQTFETGSYNLLKNFPAVNIDNNIDNRGGTTNIISNQRADVATTVFSNSNTGGNSQNGRAISLTTGSALSLANNFTLTNLTSVSGGFFLGVINILGSWKGNIAYGPYVNDISDIPTKPTVDSPSGSLTPELQITVSSNVGKFVYPGDTVLADIIVANQNAFTVRNVEVKGQLTNDQLTSIIPMNWKIGDIRPNGKTKIAFSVALQPNLPEGLYKISATATGYDDGGNEASASSSSSFWVKVKSELTKPAVPTVSTNSNLPKPREVLGTSSLKQKSNINKYLFYVLSILTILYILITSHCLARLLGIKWFKAD